MTAAEISKALALAIGWNQAETFSMLGCLVRFKENDRQGWIPFDHRDPAIAFRVAERYNKFPYIHKTLAGVPDGKWVVWPDTLADTPQDAIALSVINGEKE